METAAPTTNAKDVKSQKGTEGAWTNLGVKKKTNAKGITFRIDHHLSDLMLELKKSPSKMAENFLDKLKKSLGEEVQVPQGQKAGNCSIL